MNKTAASLLPEHPYSPRTLSIKQKFGKNFPESLPKKSEVDCLIRQTPSENVLSPVTQTKPLYFIIAHVRGWGHIQGPNHYLDRERIIYLGFIN